MADVKNLSFLNHTPKGPTLKPKGVVSALSTPQAVITLLLWTSMCATVATFFGFGSPTDGAVIFQPG